MYLSLNHPIKHPETINTYTPVSVDYATVDHVLVRDTTSGALINTFIGTIQDQRYHTFMLALWKVELEKSLTIASTQ